MIGVGVLRGNSAEEVASIMANFEPVTVPLLDRHLGDPVGWLQEIVAEGDSIWFCSTADDGLRDRLRDRSPVSMEVEAKSMATLSDDAILGLLTRAASGDGRTVIRPVAPAPLVARHYRGRFGPGWTLAGVALLPEGDTGARSSAIRAVSAEGRLR